MAGLNKRAKGAATGRVRKARSGRWEKKKKLGRPPMVPLRPDVFSRAYWLQLWIKG